MAINTVKEAKIEKGSVLQHDLTTKEQEVNVPDYTDDEKVYLGNLQRRLTTARDERDKDHVEFDNMSYMDYWYACEMGANTTIQQETNKGESVFQSGTLRTKLFAFLSTFQALNLKSDISAYNKKEIKLNSLGDAMEDIIDKTRELENDDEWKMIRQYEMLKHGYVFVEDIWFEKWEVEKKLTSKFTGKKTGVKWTTKKVKTQGTPKRSIIPGPSVYLGDMTKYMIEDQPYVFTVEVKNRHEVEKIFEKWEMWDYVSKSKRSFSSTASVSSMAANAWRFTTSLKKDQVEIVKYQDPINNEFQIILNGVPMLPIGFPLSAISPNGELTIAQQNLEPIRHNFALGKSFIFKNKNIVAVLDMMMKLAVMKTKKSYKPPYLNISNRIISSDVFLPGHIARGIQPNELVPISDKETQGVTPGEFGMIQEVTKFINENTVSPSYTGAKEQGGRVTATQILELQKQSKMMMGLLVLAASLLEKKLDTKRLMIILDKWFDPIDSVVDEARDIIKNRYRIVSRERTIEGEGKGIRMTLPMDKVPSSQKIKAAEDAFQDKNGTPIRIVALNPKELKQARLTWMLTVNPKDKKSSESAKIMFGLMMEDAMALGLRLNLDYSEDRFAQVWDEDSSKMFQKEEGGAAPGMELPPETAKKRGTRIATPQVKVPGKQSQRPLINSEQ